MGSIYVIYIWQFSEWIPFDHRVKGGHRSPNGPLGTCLVPALASARHLRGRALAP